MSDDPTSYKSEAYRQHMDALDAMRLDIERQLSGIGDYVPLLSDSRGPLPSQLGHMEPDYLRSSYRILRVDLSKGTVKMEQSAHLETEHKLLTQMNVPHEYTPCPKETRKHPIAVSSITLSLADALQYLRPVVARTNALRDASLRQFLGR